MIVIHGVLTLTAPLHTSAGAKGLKLQRDGRVAYKDSEGIPVISTVTTPICARGSYHGDLPIFPSSGLVGRLRRMAAIRVREALTSDGKTITQGMYYAQMNGHQVGAQLGAAYGLADYAKVKGDFFFGLFGGGSLRHAAAYTQKDLLPVTALTIDAGYVPQKFADLAPVDARRDIQPWQLFDYRVIRKIDDVLRGRDDAAGVNLLEGDEKREAAVAYQVIPVGTSLYWRTTLAASTTPEQRGLFLMALKDLFLSRQLGARAHLGWGGFNPQRFRWIDGETRYDLFDFSEDEEGMPVLQETKQFLALIAPATKMLKSMAKDPQDARKELAALLHV